MSAILHSITTDIENSRMKDNIKYWRWMSNIFHNKKDALIELIENFGVCCCDKCDNEYQYWEGSYYGNGNIECEKCGEMCCEECADECVCFDVCNTCFSPSMYDRGGVEKEDSDSDSDSDSEDEY